MGIEVFKKHLREKRAIKLSMGSNYDINTTKLMAGYTQELHASALDINCDKKQFETAKKYTKLPIFASSNHPYALKEALEWGVDGIEIGKYDLLRKKGQMYTPDELYNIMLETMSCADDFDTFISVCIPREYKKEEKVNLIKKFELLGIDLIRIESSNLRTEKEELFDIIDNSIASFSFLLENPNDITYALEMGFRAIDVEYIAEKFRSSAYIKSAIMSLIANVSSRNSINKEILRTSREIFAIK